jgi:hypothetical protein
VEYNYSTPSYSKTRNPGTLKIILLPTEWPMYNLPFKKVFFFLKCFSVSVYRNKDLSGDGCDAIRVAIAWKVKSKPLLCFLKSL